MREKIFVAVIIFVFTGFVSSAWCDSDKSNEMKIGVHGTVITNTIKGVDNDELSGFMVTYQRNFNNNFAARAGYFNDTHNDHSGIESSGIIAQILLGNNLLSRGSCIYGGLGFFSDKWKSDYSSQEHTFSGYLLSLAAGYKWEHVVLDFVVNFRNPSDYKHLLNKVHGLDYVGNLSSDALALSASLSVGIRF